MEIYFTDYGWEYCLSIVDKEIYLINKELKEMSLTNH